MCHDNSISYYLNIRSIDGENEPMSNTNLISLSNIRTTVQSELNTAISDYNSENAPISNKESEITTKEAEIVTLKTEEDELRLKYNDETEKVKTILGTDDSGVVAANTALTAKIAEKETAQAALVTLKSELDGIKTPEKITAVAAKLVVRDQKQQEYDDAMDEILRANPNYSNTHKIYNNIDLDHIKSKHPSGPYGMWYCRVVNFNLLEPQGLNSPSIDVEVSTFSSDQYITTNPNNMLTLATIPASETQICGDESTDIYAKDGRSTLFCIDNPTPWIIVNIGQRIMEIKLKSSISDKNINEKSSLKTLRPADSTNTDPSYFEISPWQMKLELKPFIE